MTTPIAREQEAMLRTHACRECGASLAMPYDPSTGARTLACTRDRMHEGFAKAPTLTQRYERGEGLPLHMTNRIEDRRRQQVEQGLSVAQRRALAPYAGVRSLTQEQATIILQTYWPTAPKIEVAKAAILCRDFGLHPGKGHVFLVPFEKKDKAGKVVGVNWATIISIHATRLMASRRAPYSYIDGPRVMTDEEQKAILGSVDSKNLWAITVVADTQGNRAQGYGYWPRWNQWGKENRPHGTDKGNSMLNMAFIRSERQALDRLRPGEMPTGYDVVDAAYLPEFGIEAAPADAPALPEANANGDGGGEDNGEGDGILDVDPETGEVRDNGQQPELPLSPPDAPPPPMLKTPGDVYNLAAERFELLKPAVLAIPHVKATIDVGNYTNAWEIIVAHMRQKGKA